MIRNCLLVVACILTASSVFAQNKDALQAYKAGRYQEAVDITKEELKNQPQNMDSYVVLVWSLQKMEKHQEALDYALQAKKINAYDYRIVESLGESYFHLGKGAEALSYFELYIAKAPSGDRIERAYYFMGEIYLQLADFHRADIALTTAVYYAPSVPVWWARLGYARMQTKDYPHAKKAFDEALRQNPNLSEALRGKSKVEELITTR